MKTTFIFLLSIAALCSCNNLNKAAVYKQKIKAYRDSADYIGLDYYSSKADIYTDSLTQLNNAKKHKDEHVKLTASSIADH